MDSILTSVKKMIGITEAYKQFDTDLIMHINSVFMILNQLGVGPNDGFSITDEYSTWDDFITEGDNLESVKTYIYLKVKLLFDPPQSSAVMECYKQNINELESRLNIQAELNAMEGKQNG